MEMADRGRGMPPTTFDLEALSIPRKGSGESKRIVDGPAVDEEGKAYPLARDVVKGPSRINC